MGSPFNQSTQNFFSSTGDGSLNPDAFSEESRSMAVNANNASAKETAENMRFNYRGKDVYNNVADQAVLAPYIKSSNDKKFPYLSSKHHVGQRYNLSQNTTPRNRNAMTYAEERQQEQERMLSGEFAYGGTQGSSYFGGSFNKDAEKQAKIAVKRHEYLKDAASQGEEAFNAALSTENVLNKTL